MEIKTLVFLLSISLNLTLFSQRTLSQVSIKYERKINIEKLFKNNEWAKGKNRFYIDSFELQSNGSIQRYEKLEQEEMERWTSGYKSYSNFYIDLKNKVRWANKEISGSEVHLTDSLPTYNWRIIDETRNIQGYECIKAETTIFDSIVVVAFFTPELHPESGPESFGGLPGTILGLVIPFLQSTYLAKSIRPLSENIKSLKPKGKQIDKKELEKKLMDIYKDWGENFDKIMYVKMMM
jgi:GLPGLI family protein